MQATKRSQTLLTLFVCQVMHQHIEAAYHNFLLANDAECERLTSELVKKIGTESLFLFPYPVNDIFCEYISVNADIMPTFQFCLDMLTMRWPIVCLNNGYLVTF